jgi:hypothetical protein
VDSIALELDALMVDFAGIVDVGDFDTAWQPASALADAKLQDDVTALLDAYPFLGRDEGWVAFLRRYGGALLVREDGLLLSLFGFSEDIGMHIVKGPGDPIYDGIFVFCDGSVPRVIHGRVDAETAAESVAVGFGFDATGERSPGVYRLIDGRNPTWYCATFCDWLRKVVAQDGQLRD